MVGADITNFFFLELGDKTQRGKERFPFLCIAGCLIFQLVYISQIIQEIFVNWETFFGSAYPDKVLSYKTTEFYMELKGRAVWR